MDKPLSIEITKKLHGTKIIVLKDTIIQRRKHKKKRISKKWKKKYGYETIPNYTARIMELDENKVVLDEFNGYIYMNEKAYERLKNKV